MATPLYPTFRKRINDAVGQLINQQVEPWLFLTTAQPFRISRFDGREISYQNVAFDGSPRDVFWGGYIEPFLEDITVSEIAAAVKMAKEKGVDGFELLSEVQRLLSNGYRRVYRRMADVDRRLRGKGFLNRVKLRTVDDKIDAMTQFLEEMIGAELAMWKPNSGSQNWLHKIKASLPTIGIIVTVIGIIVGIIALF